jgi:Domain of unknown function (DUF4411)
MYLLDSNVLKEAKNRYYGFAICPGFWEWVKKGSGCALLGSVAGIRDEINDGDESDELRIWINNGQPLQFFAPDAATVEAMKEVTRWVMAQHYDEQNRAAFFAKADPLLVAHAMAHEGTVVTHESYVPANSRKVKIPNVCEAMDVKWINCFEMLRNENASFHLPPTA